MGWGDSFKGKAAGVEKPAPSSVSPFSASGRQQPSAAAISAATRYSDAASRVSFSLERSAASSSSHGHFFSRQPKAAVPPRASWDEEPRRRRRSCGSIWMLVLSALQIAGAAAVVGVVATCLSDDRTEEPEAAPAAAGAPAEPPLRVTVCYLADATYNSCYFAYWAAVVGVALSLLLATVQCCVPRRRRVFCLSVEGLIGLLGCAWWLAAGTTALVSAHNASAWPHGSCRTAVWGTCFGVTALFLAAFLTSMLGCCIACGRKKEEELAELDA
jgi:hypothetical protein